MAESTPQEELECFVGTLISTQAVVWKALHQVSPKFFFPEKTKSRWSIFGDLDSGRRLGFRETPSGNPESRTPAPRQGLIWGRPRSFRRRVFGRPDRAFSRRLPGEMRPENNIPFQSMCLKVVMGHKVAQGSDK